MIFTLKTYVEQELHNTLRLCYEIKSLPRIGEWKITKLAFASRFLVNEFLTVTVLVKVFSHTLAFLRHGVAVFAKLNVFLVNISL